jgi:hypothetical protein
MTDDIVTTVIADLERQLHALGEQRDAGATFRAQEEYARRQSSLMGAIRTLRDSRRTLAEVEPQLAAATVMLQLLDVTLRKRLSDELLITEDYGRRTNLQFSLQVLDRGPRVLDESGYDLTTTTLGRYLREAGIEERPAVDGKAVGELAWPGTVGELRARVAKLTARRDDARLRLDAVVAEHDARHDMKV